ncbi:hypothetical protein AMECASPLE_028146 [Ameca splendens]|uniref:Uncharacterized protein n=1 Tax=Ameca splendens TaxID=208324 RepID=A0ABV1ADC7_9TELE
MLNMHMTLKDLKAILHIFITVVVKKTNLWGAAHGLVVENGRDLSAVMQSLSPDTGDLCCMCPPSLHPISYLPTLTKIKIKNKRSLVLPKKKKKEFVSKRFLDIEMHCIYKQFWPWPNKHKKITRWSLCSSSKVYVEEAVDLLGTGLAYDGL